MGSLLRLDVCVRGSSHIPYGGSPPQKVLCLCSSSLLLPCFCGYESGPRCGESDHDIRFELDQRSSEAGEPAPLPRGVAMLQADGLSLHVAKLVQALPEGTEGA